MYGSYILSSLLCTLAITDDAQIFHIPQKLSGAVILSCIISQIVLLVCVLVSGLCGSNDNIILSHNRTYDYDTETNTPCTHQYYNNICIIVFILILWL